MHRDESRERGIHRYEAFSDIVIGFSLAQLGVGLRIPSRVADLFENPAWFFVFIWAFGLICAMWVAHHRLFTRWFVPKPLPVMLNFAWLATIVLLVYDTQLALKFPFEMVVWRSYFVLYSLAYGLIAAQYALCYRIRSAEATNEDREGATRGIAFTVLWTAPFALCVIYTFAIPLGPVFGESIWGTFAMFGVVSWLLNRYFRSRTAVASP